MRPGEGPYVRAHYRAMGGPLRGVDREEAYHIPEGVVEYVAGLGLVEPEGQAAPGGPLKETGVEKERSPPETQTQWK